VLRAASLAATAFDRAIRLGDESFVGHVNATFAVGVAAGDAVAVAVGVGTGVGVGVGRAEASVKKRKQ
jgi:hypothetical protein